MEIRYGNIQKNQARTFERSPPIRQKEWSGSQA
jgi:hypothetical protein